MTGRARVAVLGAGPAGLAAARRLAGEPDVEVVLLAPGGVARHHAGTLDVLVGADPAAFTYPVTLAGVEVVADQATELRPGAVVAGERLLAIDAVVVAVGLELDDGAVPRAPGVVAAWDVPTAARDGLDPTGEGEVVIAVCSVPYRCPPAPFSLAMRLARAGRSVTVLTPDEQPLAGIGGPAPGALRAAVEEAGVRMERGFALDLGAGLDGVALARDGRRVPFATALVVPPHRRPAFLAELAGGGPLVAADRRGATEVPGVFAAGDLVASPLPRAAGVAEAQGMTAAEAALAFLDLAAPAPVHLPAPACALDHGDGRFSRIAIAFPDGLPPEGTPRVEVEGPSPELASLPRAAAERLRALAAGI